MSQNLLSPKQIYQTRLDEGAIKPDPMQAQAAEHLDRLYQELLLYKRKKGWFSKLQEPPRGVYFYGGVGRGKSMLMDLFYDALPSRIPAKRVHFHAFMISVHDYIHSRRSDENIRQGADESLPLFAARIAEQYQVLCFDEFHVVDIADAMILGRLYKCLFERGVVVVSTSNWAPDDLYSGGLQRDLFLPFIDLIKDKMEAFHLDSPHDYRTQFLMEEGSYFYPLNARSAAQIDAVFEALSVGDDPAPAVLNVKGRKIEVEAVAKDVARFSFDALCMKPLGAEDYLRIADTYRSVILKGVPKMKVENRNELKRFMNLVDVLYENKTRFILSADAAVDKLYSGDDHAYEFERTISRLQEMQSADYLASIG